MLRFLALDFLARIWLPKARSRMSLPEPLILMRLAVPLCVFSFGISFPFWLRLVNNVQTGNLESRKLLFSYSD